jgi:magnesium transporter
VSSSTPRLTAANLHDDVLQFARPIAFTLKSTHSVAEALEVVRATAAARHTLYFYVLDDEERLAGVVPVRHLLAAQPDERVADLMRPDVVAIPSWATVLIASEYFATRKLRAFPIIHDDGRLAGMVDIGLFTPQVIDVARETYDDIYQLLGVHATAMRTPWTSYLDRFPWLLSNIAGGLLCAIIAAQFEPLLQHAVVLALFIPVVLAVAESVSMQSATLTLQSLSDDSIHFGRIASAIWREARTAVLIGLSAAAIVSVVVLIWRRDVLAALVIGGAMTASIVMACLFGVLLPTVVRALKADPRIAAGPLVLASTDIVTLVSYLGLGSLVFAGSIGL